jgi:hypothetical protein
MIFGWSEESVLYSTESFCDLDEDFAFGASDGLWIDVHFVLWMFCVEWVLAFVLKEAGSVQWVIQSS